MRPITWHNRTQKLVSLLNRIDSCVVVARAIERQHDPHSPADKHRLTVAAHSMVRASQDIAALLRRPVVKEAP